MTCVTGCKRARLPVWARVNRSGTANQRLFVPGRQAFSIYPKKRVSPEIKDKLDTIARMAKELNVSVTELMEDNTEERG